MGRSSSKSYGGSHIVCAQAGKISQDFLNRVSLRQTREHGAQCHPSSLEHRLTARDFGISDDPPIIIFCFQRLRSHTAWTSKRLSYHASPASSPWTATGSW